MEKRSDNAGIPWLFDELGDLAKQQVVSPETVTALQDYYQPKALANEQAAWGRMHLYLTSILSGFAALLIVGGIILVFNYNWDDLSREIRSAIAITPALLGLGLAGWVLACKKSRPWREFAGIWLMLSAYSSLGIIAQTYNLGGKFSTFMMAVTLATLFVPVLLRSLGANIIQLISFIIWAFSAIEIWGTAEPHHKIVICAGLLLALLPYYLSTRVAKGIWERRFDSIALVISSYFLTPLLLSELVPEQHRIFCLLLLTVACVQLLVGRWIKLHGDNRVAWPWHVGGWFGLAFMSTILSINTQRFLGDGNLLSWWLLPILGLIAYTVWRTLRKQWFESLVGILPLAVFCVWSYLGDNEPLHNIARTRSSGLLGVFSLSPLLMTLLFVLFSIIGATIGYLKRDGGIFTGSMIVLLMAIMVRFFDGSYSSLTRGLVFLAAGVVVLAVNLLADRLFKNKADSITEDPALPIIQQIIE